MDPPSSSITSSSYLSNGTSPCSLAALPPGALAPPLPTGVEGWGGGGASSSVEVVSLHRLSNNLERLLVLDPDLDCSDADVDMADGGPLIPVHRCILAARSPFFHEFIRRSRGDSLLLSASVAGGGGGGDGKGTGRPRYKMEELVPGGRVGREAFLEFVRYLYTGKLRPAPHDVVSCADHVCPHDSCPPAIRLAVELMYAAWTFKISDLIVLFQRRLLNFVDKALAEDVLPILQVAFHSELSEVLEKCVQRIARSDLDIISLDKELPPEIADEIKKIRQKSPPNDVSDPVHEKRVRRIHRALDSDDVELVKLLLNESAELTLDDANALHYAAAYCDSKVVSELLDLGLANLNLKNVRGYTSLHLAAMRREPAIIMCLLNKGAVASQLTDDGRLASNICRRLTRAKDYNAKIEQGQESNKDRMCIEILEREMMRNHMIVEDAVTSPLLADDLQMKLGYLENRVALARFFFPAEAKVAMHISHADIIPEVGGVSAASTSGKLKEVDLNETPHTQNKRLRERVDALAKTVELGRRYFPNCSQVLDKILEHDLSDEFDVFHQQNGTPDEQKVKKMRLGELKEDVRKAYSKDTADNSAYSVLSSNSSSSPPQTAAKK